MLDQRVLEAERRGQIAQIGLFRRRIRFDRDRGGEIDLAAHFGCRRRGRELLGRPGLRDLAFQELLLFARNAERGKPAKDLLALLGVDQAVRKSGRDHRPQEQQRMRVFRWRAGQRRARAGRLQELGRARADDRLAVPIVRIGFVGEPAEGSGRAELERIAGQLAAGFGSEQQRRERAGGRAARDPAALAAQKVLGLGEEIAALRCVGRRSRHAPPRGRHRASTLSGGRPAASIQYEIEKPCRIDHEGLQPLVLNEA
mgnify:CR=1 FL=1